MMVLGDGGSALGLAVVVLALVHGAGLTVLCTGVALSSCLAALTEPVLRATVTDVVEETDYVRASGAVQLASAARFLLAPALAAAGLVVGGAGLAPSLRAVTGTGPGRGAAVLVAFLGPGVIGAAALTHRARHRLAPALTAEPPRDGAGRPTGQARLCDRRARPVP